MDIIFNSKCAFVKVFRTKFHFYVKMPKCYNFNNKPARVNMGSEHKQHTTKINTISRLQISGSLESNGKSVDLE